MIEWVVAHYQEDLSWLLQVQSRVHLYSKGNSDVHIHPKRFTSLPNVGRESHTYLYHICHHYYSLADITIFCQGTVSDHVVKKMSALAMEQKAITKCKDLLPYTNLTVWRDWDGIQHYGHWLQNQINGTMLSSEYTPCAFWTWVFNTTHPPFITMFYNGIFAVTRAAIHRHPLEFYTRLVQYLESLDHPDPEVGHFFERFWYSMFRGV